MTIDELLKMCRQHVDMGLGSTPLILKMKTERRIIRSKRVKTPFGLCKWHRHSEDELVIYVYLDQVKNYVDKVLSKR